MEIIPLGDCALLWRAAENFTADPRAALAAIRHAQKVLESAKLPGLIECVPAYETLAIFYDLVALADFANPFAEMKAQVETALGQRGSAPAETTQSPSIEVPVCYDAEFAPDLELVASHCRLRPDEVVERHRAGEYLVHCLGFTPGFPYLGGLLVELATPRKASPRKKVAAGSVAIGGAQTGIYPAESPGGWNIIGRTPLRLFDPMREPAALLQPGMRVRFCAISRAEFEAHKNEIAR